MSQKVRLDQALVSKSLVSSRSQASSYIKLGDVKVNGKVVTKAGELVRETDDLVVTAKEQYVSRAALKLASVAETLNIDFRDQVVLDVGSSTGGFTEFALRHGAKKVIAVEVGKDQLHPSLRGNEKIELYEQTDIRDIQGIDVPDLVVADVSFISLRQILPHIATLCSKQTKLAVMVKPQFEAEHSKYKHKGIIKNDKMRRDILKDFEDWTRNNKFVILDKADSSVSGAKGNQERFYLLRVG